jgi:rhodanese-related sulfurtransferase
MQQVSVTDLNTWLTDPTHTAPQVLDVRETWELERASLPGTLHIPMREVPSRMEELPRDQPLAVLCHHGGRSMQVVVFLQHHGFTQAVNVAGGIDAWSQVVDPSVPRY